MSELDRLYHLEIEFHRRFRLEAIDAMEAESIHTSYALQLGYEELLRSLGRVDRARLDVARHRMQSMGDPRDVQAAFHSLQQIVALR